MASAHWRTGHTVNSLLAQKNGTGWNFLQLVRLVLRLRRTADVTSGKQPASDNELLEILADTVRFRASLAADFPPWDVREVSLSEQGITAITLAHGGLMSPDGPLPAPFIEWLRDRSEQDDHAMLDFLELFNNRLMALRYLVHRSTRPTLMDAPAEVSDSGRLMQALAGRLSEGGAAHGVAEVSDFLLLAVVNRTIPLIRHMTQIENLHPEDLYRTCISLAGELSVFMTAEKQPPEFPPYTHDNLSACFTPVIRVLRQYLSSVLEQTAIPIALDPRKYGISVGVIADRKLLGNAGFVLAVDADIPAEDVRRHFAGQAKIGPVEEIRQLVNSALPGITLRPLPVAPRQIPYHAGVVYFEMDADSPYWAKMTTSGGIAVHVSGQYPGLKMELWAIRNN